jgi:hypothetical protein
MKVGPVSVTALYCTSTENNTPWVIKEEEVREPTP